MTDTPQPKKVGFWRKHFLARSFPKDAALEGRPFVFYTRRYDAQFYALIVALGLPLMGWLVGDVRVPFTQFVISSFDIKLTIAAVWIALAHEYWALELDEIRAQIQANNLLDVEESDYQRSTMQSLYWGVAFAAAVWVAFAIVFVVTLFALSKPLWYGPSYGLIELAVGLHTLWVGRRVIKRVYPLISIIQQALAGQLRRETGARTD